MTDFEQDKIRARAVGVQLDEPIAQPKAGWFGSPPKQPDILMSALAYQRKEIQKAEAEAWRWRAAYHKQLEHAEYWRRRTVWTLAGGALIGWLLLGAAWLLRGLVAR